MAVLMEEMSRESALRERGWVPFINPPHGSPSPIGRTIEIIDREGMIFVTPYNDIPALWNVAGKFWREYSPQWHPEDIARFKSGNLPPLIPNRIGTLADAHSKSPSRPAMPKEEDTHG